MLLMYLSGIIDAVVLDYKVFAAPFAQVSSISTGVS